MAPLIILVRERAVEHGILLKGKSRPTTQCPFCKKEGGINNMTRWHFQNCRQKNLIAVMAEGD